MSTADNTNPTAIFQPFNTLTLADAAERYAAMGLKVFPLQANSKLPMAGWSWKRMATSDVDTVRAWWRQWPLANIGIALGAPSGVDALDIDVKNGQDGRRSYQAITQDAYDGPVQQTPTGGQHLLFKHADGLINFTHKGHLGGLDMRTTGGYIVAAPSHTPDGPYWWAQDGKVPAMPDALRAACRQWSAQQNTVTVDMPDVPEDLPDVRTLGLRPQYLDYLERGETGPWMGDESRAVFATAGALMQRLNDPGVVYGLLCANPYAWACAERHRPFGDVGVWLWKYGVSKIIARVVEGMPVDASRVFSPLPSVPPEAVGAGLPAPAEPAETFFTSAATSIDRAKLAPQWVVKGLIERAQVGVIYGDSQALKSYLMLDLSVGVVCGGVWHGSQVVAPGPVWFLAGEGNAILWRRLEALRQARGLASEQVRDLWLSSQGLNLMNAADLDYLRQWVGPCGGPPRMLVVDTLSSNAVLDENNARDAAQLISICYRIAKEWDCTVALVHHVGKGNKGTARGSSVLQTNTDFRIRLEREAGQRIITKAYVEKLKGAPEPAQPLVFEGHIRTIVGVLDDDMAPVTDLVLERLQGADANVETVRAQVKLGEAMAAAYGHVQEALVEAWGLGRPGDGLLRHELWQAYVTRVPNATQKAFSTLIDKLVTKGLLVQRFEGDQQVLTLPKGSPLLA